jgi:NhaA family Na+:H+ antiporter
VVNNTAYILVGLVLWTAVLRSGVHATLAGVILGLMIPIKNNHASFHALERSLHVPVNFFILPLFAFANTGIAFGNVTVADLTDRMTLGIMFGLFLGKQAGVFLFTWIAMKFQKKSFLGEVTFGQIYGVALLSGIGFTMSLFIGTLAFECSSDVCYQLADVRMGILVGSFLSGVAGYFVLRSQLGQSA